MRDLGAIPSPHNHFTQSWTGNIAPADETTCSNALEVAEYLQNHPKVKWIKHPGLPGDQYYERLVSLCLRNLWCHFLWG